MLLHYLTLLFTLTNILSESWSLSNLQGFCKSKQNGNHKLAECSNVFAYCKNSRLEVKHCSEGWVYQENLQYCIKQSEAEQCSLLSNVERKRGFCIGKIDGKYPTNDCSKYYVVCLKGKTLLGRCLDGFLFSSLQKDCVKAKQLVECQDYFARILKHRLLDFTNETGIIDRPYYIRQENAPGGGSSTDDQESKFWLLPIFESDAYYTQLLLQASQYCSLRDNGIYAPTNKLYTTELILCNNHTGILLRCPDREVFSKSLQRCTPIDSKRRHSNIKSLLLRYACNKFGHGFHGPSTYSSWYIECSPSEQNLVICPLGTKYVKLVDACIQKALLPQLKKEGICQRVKGRKLFRLSRYLNHFLICYEGMAFLKTCSDHLVRHYAVHNDTTDSEHPIVTCEKGEKKRIAIDECSPYYLDCSYGSLNVLKCTSGRIFNEQMGICIEPSSNEQCATRRPNPCEFKTPGSYALNQRSPVYLKCFNHTFSWIECQNGTHFNSKEGMCMQEENWLSPAVKVDNVKLRERDLKSRVQRDVVNVGNPCLAFIDQIKVIPTATSAYVICVYGTAYWYTCPQNHVFDVNIMQCVLRSENYGPMVASSLPCENELKALQPCSNTYIQCVNGNAYHASCPGDLVFSHRLQARVPNSQNSHCAEYAVNVCNLNSNEVLPIAPCYGSYIQCTNGVAKTRTCPEGSVFFNITRSCVQRWENPYCVQTPCPATGYTLKELEPCSHAYVACVNGKAYSQVCPGGKVFYGPINACVTKAENPLCPQSASSLCQPDKNGLYALEPCSNRYIQCTNGLPNVSTCPEDTVFYNVTSSCVPKWQNAYCLSTLCPPNEYTLKALESCSGTYVACMNGRAYSQVCPDGKVFYESFKACVTKAENPNCAMHQGRSNNPCYPKKSTMIALEPCSGTYLQCSNGVPINRVCSGGKVFWNQTMTCVSKSENPYCPGIHCPTTGYSLKALEPCSGTYVMCENGVARTMLCSSGQVFLSTLGRCVDKAANPFCGQQSTCSFEGEFIPDPSDCTIFYRCTHGRKVKFTCPPGTAFNTHINVCDWKENVSTCRTS